MTEQESTMTQENPKTDATREQHSHEAEEHVHGPDCAHTHEHNSVQPFVRASPKIGRNDPCACGSGQKFKKCCGGASEASH
jgi:uncharacterized protein YecA (UPF0149 family)